jgi:hypothetical protein
VQIGAYQQDPGWLYRVHVPHIFGKTLLVGEESLEQERKAAAAAGVGVMSRLESAAYEDVACVCRYAPAKVRDSAVEQNGAGNTVFPVSHSLADIFNNYPVLSFTE